MAPAFAQIQFAPVSDGTGALRTGCVLPVSIVAPAGAAYRTGGSLLLSPLERSLLAGVA